MTLSYTVKEGKAILKSGTKKIDEVGPWLTDEEAEAWASAVCDKYNSEEYSGINYPEEKPRESIPAE